MGDKRPLVGALVLITIGVVAAVLFRKPSEPTTADTGESVLRRHEPVGLAAGARPFAEAEFDYSPNTPVTSNEAAAPVVGLVGRITPVSVNPASVIPERANPAGTGSLSPSGQMTAVPAADLQRLPSVTSPLPDHLLQSSTLTRQYPSTSYAEQSPLRQPAAATSVDSGWATDTPKGDPAATVADEGTDVPRIRLHTIRDGDSLSSLAKRFLGDGGRYLEIYEANRDVLHSPEQLPIGGQLRIPRGSKLTPGGTARGPGGSSSDPRRLVPVSPRPPRS